MTETKPKRRWFRFSLRTLFVLVLMLALPMAWLSWQLSIAHRLAMLKQIEVECGDSILPFNSIARNNDVRAYYDPYLPKPAGKLPWYRTMFGDRLVPLLCLPPSTSGNELAKIKITFPEATVTQVPTSLAPDMASVVQRWKKGNPQK
jgi:hypothetical protein